MLHNWIPSKVKRDTPESEESDEPSCGPVIADFYIEVGTKRPGVKLSFVRASDFWIKRVFPEENHIACGSFGCVYPVCVVSASNEVKRGVIKIGKISQLEQQMAQYAAEHELGPLLITEIFEVAEFNKFGYEYEKRAPTVNINKAGNTYEFHSINVICMERFPYTAFEIFTFRPYLNQAFADRFVERLRALYRKQQESLFVHGDIHNGNVLVRPNGISDMKLVLVDFGFSFRVWDFDSTYAKKLIALDWLLQLSLYAIRSKEIYEIESGGTQVFHSGLKKDVTSFLFDVMKSFRRGGLSLDNIKQLYKEIHSDYSSAGQFSTFKFSERHTVVKFPEPMELLRISWPQNDFVFLVE